MAPHTTSGRNEPCATGAGAPGRKGDYSRPGSRHRRSPKTQVSPPRWSAPPSRLVGSIGTALLNTIAASSTAGYLLSHSRGRAATNIALVHRFSTAYWWAKVAEMLI